MASVVKSGQIGWRVCCPAAPNHASARAGCQQLGTLAHNQRPGAAAKLLSRSAKVASPTLRHRTHNILVASAQAANTSPSNKVDVVEGVKVVPALISVALGLAVRFLVPIPEGITVQAWTLLSIFLSTVVGLVLAPLPVGAWAVVAITTTIATSTLSFQQAFSAMTNEVIWLIVASFFFAKGFEKTGLGERIANLFVKLVGKSTLGLALGLNFAEALVSPAMPSTSARAGGIFMPVIHSLSQSAGSKPGEESRHKMGAFLTQAQFQTSVHSSNLFLTAAAQNLLCLKLAAEVGAVVENAFVVWLQGAIVPALIGLIATPLLLYALAPPEVKDTPQAPLAADERLKKMGPMKKNEAIMLGVMLLAVTLWVLGETLRIPAVVAALIGLSALLLTGVLSWQDCLSYGPAWDTLTWFAVLIGMSGQLNTLGVIQFFADNMASMLLGLNLGWPVLFGALHLAFFGMHYMFASQTAHVGAVYAAFCAIMVNAGVPPVLAALSLAYNVNLFGSITHFASGQAAVYFGAGFMKLGEVFSLGAICGVFSLALWGTVGMAWWKVLGWW